MFNLTRLIYSLVFYAALPFIFLRLWIKGRALPMYRWRYQERLGFYQNKNLDRQDQKQQNIASGKGIDIWVHAVSLGEVIAITPLIECLLADKYSILVTTMTPTGSARVTQQFSSRVEHCYIPYDIPSAVKRFYQHFAPRIALIVETELWPNLLFHAQKKGIELILCNARLSNKSCQEYRKLRWFFRPLLQKFSGIYSQSDADASRFIALGADLSCVHVFGNIKFDMPVNTVEMGPYLAIKKLWKNRLIIIVASTHEDEELQILNVWCQLQAQIPEVLLLIAPRHPERFDKIYQLALDKGFKTGLRSKVENLAQEKHEVIILDCLGELLGFYAISDYSFVGGSLVPRGGHNVLEPIAMHVPVLIGPHYFNFEYICQTLLSNQAIIEVQSAQELVNSIVSLEKNPSSKTALCQKSSKTLEANKGALQKYRLLVQKSLA